jgi:hypothetical protein
VVVFGVGVGVEGNSERSWSSGETGVDDDDGGWGGANQRWGSGRAVQLMGTADGKWRCFCSCDWKFMMIRNQDGCGRLL